ncbi:arsenic metallochaperone ArsD family protein [Mycoplasma bradburyae]|uniref:arsenic metallochaperone ArsD family protein n=1 Tax=Mycoplasma bradburyae TaxID=2963128 RepID=UPI00233FD95A|nr:arsenic metallochaperone ArsD family protein [Mycoplasma bradburyae]
MLFGLLKPSNNNGFIYSNRLKNQAELSVSNTTDTINDNGSIYRKSIEKFDPTQKPGYEHNNNFNGLKLTNGGYIFISGENDSDIYRTDYFYNTLWIYRFESRNSVNRHVIEVIQDTNDPSSFYVLTAPKNNDEIAIRAYSNGDPTGFGSITKLKENLDRDINKRVDFQAEIFIDPQSLISNIPSSWNNSPEFLKNTVGLTNNGQFVFSYNNYLSNLANVVIYRQNIYIVGGNGNIDPMISDRFQSLGIFRIDKNLNSVIGWPYAVLIGGWVNHNNNNKSVNLPIFEDDRFSYVIRGAIAGAKVISDTGQIQIGGSFSIGDDNVLNFGDNDVKPVRSNSTDLQLLGTFRLNLTVLDSLGAFVSPIEDSPNTNLKKLNPMFLTVSGYEDFNFNNNGELFNNKEELRLKSKLSSTSNYFYNNVSNFSFGFDFGAFTMQFNDLTIVFDTNDRYYVIQPPSTLMNHFGSGNDKYNWDNYVNSISSANYASIRDDTANNTIIIFWSKKKQNVNNKVALVYVVEKKNGGYISRPITSINQNILDKTQQISNDSNFGIYPIKNVVSLNGIQNILVYLDSNNSNLNALSLFNFSIDEATDQLIIDNNYQNTISARDAYLGNGELLLNPGNDDLFVYNVQKIITPYGDDYRIKNQYINLFIKYNRGTNNRRPNLLLLIKKEDLDLMNQSFKMQALVQNPLVKNYYEPIPGLNFKYRYYGFGANPSWVFRFIIIASIVFFVPLVWIGIIFVLRFYGFSLRDYIEIEKKKHNEKQLLSSFKEIIDDYEKNLVNDSNKGSLIEKQYGELMKMIDVAQHRQFNEKLKVYLFESSVISKTEGDDLGMRLLKTKLQLLQRYFIDNGVACYRYNLKDHKDIFLSNPKLINHLKKTNFKLPVIMDNNDILHFGSYPTNEEISSMFGININWLKKIDALTWRIVHDKNNQNFYNSPKFSNAYVDNLMNQQRNIPPNRYQSQQRK